VLLFSQNYYLGQIFNFGLPAEFYNRISWPASRSSTTELAGLPAELYNRISWPASRTLQ